MREFAIPVVFDVTAETEEDAAKFLIGQFNGKSILDYYGSHKPRIESWWMPNHPDIDRNDNPEVVVFVPTPEPKTQKVANDIISAFYRYMGDAE